MKQLLRLYPKAWRARYEDEFIALLEESPPAPFDAFDVILGALDAHLRPQVSVDKVKSERRTLMNSISFTRWSGLASMIGGILFVLGFIGASMISDDEYPYTYGLGDVLMSLLVSASLLLMLVGLVGRYAKWGALTGVFGRVSLIAAMLAVLTMLTSVFLQLAEILGWFTSGWWDLLIIGFMVWLIGSSLFAIAGLRAHVLPTWGALTCIIGGVGTLATMLVSAGLVQIPKVMQDAIGSEAAVGAAMAALSLIFIAGWVWMSYTLWANKSAVSVQPEPTTT